MNTTEKIVEAYVRYVKGWATIPNIRCKGQLEIDLLAIDPVSDDRYHIETSVLVATGFGKLRDLPFDEQKLKVRGQQPFQRRTFDFFDTKKFSSAAVVAKLGEYGFEPGRYKKVIVTWGYDPSLVSKAEAKGIELWDFPDVLTELSKSLGGSRAHYMDDTLRTLQLYDRVRTQQELASRRKAAQERVARPEKSPQAVASIGVNKSARIRELSKAGMRPSQIAKELGIRPQFAHNVLREMKKE
jgi:hypothetical protein